MTAIRLADCRSPAMAFSPWGPMPLPDRIPAPTASLPGIRFGASSKFLRVFSHGSKGNRGEGVCLEMVFPSSEKIAPRST